MWERDITFLISLSFGIILFPSMLEILYTQPTKTSKGKSLLFLVNFSGFLNLLFYAISLINVLNIKRKIFFLYSTMDLNVQKERLFVKFLLFSTILFSVIYNTICCFYFWRCKLSFLEEYFNNILYFLLFNIFVIDVLIIVIILYIINTFDRNSTVEIRPEV